ncbi:hypothetical protein ACFL57_03735 [Candidatus Margulisiibacteriota bacterium]
MPKPAVTADIKVVIGEFPPFWDKSVIFFANLQSIFFGNQEQTDQLVEELKGVPTYGGRLVPLLDLIFKKKQNLIFLEALPDKALLEYLGNRLGLSLPGIEVLPDDYYDSVKKQILAGNQDAAKEMLSVLREHPAKWMDGFVTGRVLARLAAVSGKQTISSFDGSRDGNNKYLLYCFLKEEGLPVFDTVPADTPDDAIAGLEELKKMGYQKAVIKSQIGASGYGMMLCDTDADGGAELPEFLFYNKPCLVQGWIDETVAGIKRIGSPSVQMFLSDDELYLFDITEQFLKDDSVHEGNISPPPYLSGRPDIKEQLLVQAAKAGRWLYSQGYRGTASIDYLVVEKDGVLTVHICEINARVTGATYPAVLARHFVPDGSWLMRNIRFHTSFEGADLLAKLEEYGLLFDRQKTKGILPFNFNLDADNKVDKGQFIFIGSDPAECMGLMEQVQSNFKEAYSFARD